LSGGLGGRLNQDIASLFDAVADLAPADREAYYRQHDISPQLRAEVESFVSFDQQADTLIVGAVAAAASQAASILQRASLPDRCGPFQPKKLLGQGGMGTVWLAERVDGEVEQVVAVKLLQTNLQFPRVHERFIQERRILASLSHSNIARLLDAGRNANGKPYLVMEYVEGEAIDEYCQPLDVQQTLRVFLKVCGAVSYAHGMLVVHRDLKPSNILVTREGEPKLLDFGIAKLITPDAERTDTIGRLLSPQYASPEQVKGEDTGTAADIYSLGAVLYKLLTGRSPHRFGETSPATAVSAIICERDVKRPSEFNRTLAGDLECILLKALRKEPHERYASVEKLAEDIEAYLGHRPVLARSGNMLYRGRRFFRRHWFAVTGPALAMAGLAGGMVVAEQQRRVAENARSVAELRRVEAARERSTALMEAKSAGREREEADRQRTIAERRFDQLRQLALHLLDLDKEIMRLDGGTKARQSLVTTALLYLEKLRLDGGTKDLGFRLELAEAYRKVADVQAGPGHPNLAQIKEALANLESAEKLLLTGDRADAQTLATLVENLDVQTRIAASAQDWPSAHKRFDRGARYLQALSAKAPGMDETQRLAMLTSESSLEYTAQAIFVNLEQTKDAVVHGSRAAAARARIYRLTGKPGDEANYATTMLGLANTLRLDGSLEAALEQAAAGRKILERQYEAANGQTAAARRLDWACNVEGRLLGSMDTVSLGRFDEAERTFERGLTIARKVVDSDREDISTRATLAYLANELGLLRLESNPASALELFDEAYRRRSEIPPSNPSNEEKNNMLAASIRALVQLGRHDEAKARLDKLFAALRDAKEYPGTVRPGNSAANALIAKAEAAAGAGHVDEAVQIWKELIAAYDASDRRAADDLHWAMYHSAAYRGLAKALALDGKSADERAWRERDAALWSGWNRKLPRNTFVMHQLAAAETLR
jgi:tetratricopeptide (TPR) repeat protein